MYIDMHIPVCVEVSWQKPWGLDDRCLHCSAMKEVKLLLKDCSYHVVLSTYRLHQSSGHKHHPVVHLQLVNSSSAPKAWYFSWQPGRGVEMLCQWVGPVGLWVWEQAIWKQVGVHVYLGGRDLKLPEGPFHHISDGYDSWRFQRPPRDLYSLGTKNIWTYYYYYDYVDSFPLDYSGSIWKESLEKSRGFEQLPRLGNSLIRGIPKMIKPILARL